MFQVWQKTLQEMNHSLHIMNTDVWGVSSAQGLEAHTQIRAVVGFQQGAEGRMFTSPSRRLEPWNWKRAGGGPGLSRSYLLESGGRSSAITDTQPGKSEMFLSHQLSRVHASDPTGWRCALTKKQKWLFELRLSGATKSSDRTTTTTTTTGITVDSQERGSLHSTLKRLGLTGRAGATWGMRVSHT